MLLTTVYTAQTERDCLPAPRPPDGAAAARALLQLDVAGLGCPGDELQASLLMVSLHGLGYHHSLTRPELAGDGVGDLGPRPLLRGISDRISNKSSRPQVNVSLE